MATKISYLNETWNPITGCSGKGCATKETCWAKGMVKRFPALHGFFNEGTGGIPEEPLYDPIPFSTVQFHPDRLDQPLHWKKPRRVGVAFMGDLFDDQVPFQWQHEVWDMMKRCPQHQFFVLTKQPQNMVRAVSHIYSLEAMGHANGFWNHVYVGVSCCTQADVDRMVPDLLRVPGKKWISLEPMMGKMILPLRCEKCGYSKADQLIHWDHKLCNGEIPDIGWVVIGSHSNPRRYPCKQEWVESVVEQCQAAGVKVYVKQLDINNKCVRDIERFPKHLQVREMP